MRILHWVIGIMVIGLLTSGIISNLDIKINKGILFKYHKSVGFTVMLLMFLRLFIRLFSKIPKWPKELNKTFHYLALIVQYSMYVFVLISAISGYTMSSAANKKIYWLFNMEKPVPLVVAQNKNIAYNAHKIHVKTVWIVLALVILHVLGTLKHLVIDRYNIIKRIL